MEMPEETREMIGGNVILREMNTLREWTATVSLGSPNLLLTYNEICARLESLPLCKIDVSQKEGHIAIMSHDRELEISELEDEQMVVKARVKVLAERFPEWCILKWADSGLLLISTRSDAVIDVFDSSGGYCYSIPLGSTTSSFDVHTVISHISTVACMNEESKWLDTLYALQFNGAFSSYKIGRLAFFPLFKVDLGQNVATSFVVIPATALLIVASQYRVNSAEEEEDINCSMVGLSVYRILNEAPFIADLKTSRSEASSWEVLSSWLPFFRPQTAIILSLVANNERSHLACASSAGDVFIFDLPSMRIVKHVRCYGNESPKQIVWTNRNDLGVLREDGSFLWCKLDELESVLNGRGESTQFSQCTRILSPHSGVVFVLEAHVLSSEGNRSLLAQQSSRAWLAAKLRLTTLYDYFKVYVGAAVGQPLEDVPEAYERRETKFALHDVRSVTLPHMFRKMLARGDFTGALKLAERYEVADVDFIYKEHWKQLKEQVDLSDVQNVLAMISDASFVVNECLSSRVLKMEVQNALITLAIRTASEAGDVGRVLHCKRVLQILEGSQDPVQNFIMLRWRSLLDIAVHFAQTCNFDCLNRLIANNSEIIPHLFTILWMIPECVNPKRFSHLIPFNCNGWFHIETGKKDRICLEKSSVPEKIQFAFENYNFESDVYETNAWLLKYTKPDSVEVADVVEYLKQRCYEIDVKTGLTHLVVSFVQCAVDHGFTELKSFLVSVEFYRDYVLLCGTVSLSLKDFNCSNSDALFRAIVKHMSEEDVCANMVRLIELLEYLYHCGRCESCEVQLRDLLSAFCATSLRVLQSAEKARPQLITEEIRIACFRAFERVGEPLISGAEKLGVSGNMTSALKLFSLHNFEPTFDQLYSSLNDPELASQVLLRMMKSSKCKTHAQWAALKNDALVVHDSLYSHLLSREQVLKALATQLLDLENISKTREFLDLVFSYEQTDCDTEERLSQDASINILIEKSMDYWNVAEARSDDRNLRLAKEVLNLAPSGCSSKLASQMRQLDALLLALRLGSKVLPVKFRLVDPDQLLSDVVKIESNYRKAKDCAHLAKLLGVRKPVARAMELCAVEALLRRDEHILRKYCEKLMMTAKGMPDIHSLCLEIIRSKLLADMEEELLACAVLNCPVDDLLETMSMMSETATACSEELSPPGPVEPSEEIILDPMYAGVDECIGIGTRELLDAKDPRNVRIDKRWDIETLNSSLASLARQYSHISSTVALYISVFLPQHYEWTRNGFLKQYSMALRIAHEKWPRKRVDLISPNDLIACCSGSIIESTAIERILNSGCDRERFLEDCDYRLDTLVGLAMTTSERILEDCVEIAKKYRMDLSRIFFSTLEHIFTDPDVSVDELKQMAVNKELRKCLTAPRNKKELYRTLRLRILPCFSSRRDEDVAAEYLSFFADSEPESHSMPALHYFSELLKGRDDWDFPLLLSGEPNAIVPVIQQYLTTTDNLDDFCINARLLPKGDELCTRAAYAVFDDSRREKSAESSLLICYELMNKDPSAIVDMIANLPTFEEEEYIRHVLRDGNFKAPEMESLYEALKDRLHMLNSVLAPLQNVTDFFGGSVPAVRRRHH